MIPNRMPSSEIFGSGLKQRVTACRKRLRVNRSLHKVQSIDEPTLFPDPGASFPAEYPVVGESLADAPDFRDRRGWLRPEQEVGIT